LDFIEHQFLKVANWDNEERNPYVNHSRARGLATSAGRNKKRSITANSSTPTKKSVKAKNKEIKINDQNLLPLDLSESDLNEIEDNVE